MSPLALPDSAPGHLTIDLAALADNWRTLATSPPLADAPQWSRPTPMASASTGPRRPSGAPAQKPSSSPTWRGDRGTPPPAGGRGDLFLNGLEAGADPADYRPSPEARHWRRRRARALVGLRRPKGTGPAAALHLDTGMRRLGFHSLGSLNAAMAAHGAASGADLLISHFVSSELPDDPLNALQIARFAAARAAFPHLHASFANSSAMFLGARPIHDLARPGYALYGGNPTPGQPNPMRPVVTLTVAVQQTRWIEAGESCGYNAQWTAKRRTRLATLLAGYADGLPRAAGATDARPGPRSRSRANGARWSGGCRWTSSSPT